jgi:hypothetical protein
VIFGGAGNAKEVNERAARKPTSFPTKGEFIGLSPFLITT